MAKIKLSLRPEDLDFDGEYFKYKATYADIVHILSEEEELLDAIKSKKDLLQDKLNEATLKYDEINTNVEQFKALKAKIEKENPELVSEEESITEK
jgi:hypothetical protein